MDTTDTTTDLVIIDAEIVEDDEDTMNPVAKTLATTAATSALVIGAVLAYKFLAPKLASMLHRSNDETEETVEVTTETPETAEV